MAAMAERIQGIEFGQNLLVRLGSWHSAVQLDYIAKLAIERTAARELDADMEIILKLQEVEARRGTPRDVGPPHRRLKEALLGPASAATAGPTTSVLGDRSRTGVDP
jgi:hypothetical protein